MAVVPATPRCNVGSPAWPMSLPSLTLKHPAANTGAELGAQDQHKKSDTRAILTADGTGLPLERTV